ncbi:hypothetical protein LTR08_004039 [Meristemomyces frigidus]|nr:hypothetical protein LTR08_004039 [Meristemomyces frigidus]
MMTPTSTLFRNLATAQFLRPAARAYTVSPAYQASTGSGNILSDKGTQQDTSTSSGKDEGGSRDHALDKGKDGDSNIQSRESAAGREYAAPTPFRLTPDRNIRATRGLGLRTGTEGFSGDEVVWEATYADISRSSKAQDTGGQAVREKDERNSTEKAKKDHPEAPDVVIGMQDERGGKGA